MSVAHILTINAGSSSVKLALFTVARIPEKVCEAAVENIGQPSPKLRAQATTTAVHAADHIAAVHILIDWLTQRVTALTIVGVGHRIVHGGATYHESRIVTNQMLADLRKLAPFDPEHLPSEIQLIETLQELFPDIAQVACFDTAFHYNLPTRARLLPIPRQFTEMGIRRYGFHGLSYAYILEELKRVEGTAAAHGKVIIAHLGSGASLAAIHQGKPIDTTMSMTPTSGIPMSTRSGDLDPGLLLYLVRTQGFDAERFNYMTNFESGLLGVSGISPDMKELLEIEPTEERAKEAIDLFCYQVQKTIGGFAAALGGLNTLVFTGGMGENAPKIRERVCEGLEFLGITGLDAAKNQEGARLISASDSRVGVHVIHTDEAMTIARQTLEVIESQQKISEGI